MTLPYDYARCSGSWDDCVPHPDCVHCLRRTSPGRPEGWQAWMAPHNGPGPCPDRIGETK
jgi:hypothetical protein